MIENIMNNFDFVKVYRAMVALDWNWSNKRVPYVDELRKTARELLEAVNNNESNCRSTGGFCAHKDEDGILYLEFILEDWNDGDE